MNSDRPARLRFSERTHDDLHGIVGALEADAITVIHLMDAIKALIEAVSPSNPAGAAIDQVYSIAAVAARIAGEAKERCNDIL